MNSIHHGWSLDEIAPEARRAAERAAEAAGMPLEIWLNQLIKYVSAMELSGKGPARARAIDETIKRAAAEQARIGPVNGPADESDNTPMMLETEAPTEQPTTLAAEVLEPNRFAEEHPGERDIEQAIGEWRKSGALKPLVVRPDSRKAGYYEIVSGMERWHAASRLHMRRIPVTVQQLSDEEVLRATLIQKLNSKSLPPLDEAQIYQRLMEETGLSVAALSDVIGRSPTHVATALQLLDLPEPVREMINSGELSVLHARTLLGAADPEPAAREVVARRLDIYQTEQLVRASRGALTLSAARVEKAAAVAPEAPAAEPAPEPAAPEPVAPEPPAAVALDTLSEASAEPPTNSTGTEAAETEIEAAIPGEAAPISAAPAADAVPAAAPPAFDEPTPSAVSTNGPVSSEPASGGPAAGEVGADEAPLDMADFITADLGLAPKPSEPIDTTTPMVLGGIEGDAGTLIEASPAIDSPAMDSDPDVHSAFDRPTFDSPAFDSPAGDDRAAEASAEPIAAAAGESEPETGQADPLAFSPISTELAADPVVVPAPIEAREDPPIDAADPGGNANGRDDPIVFGASSDSGVPGNSGGSAGHDNPAGHDDHDDGDNFDGHDHRGETGNDDSTRMVETHLSTLLGLKVSIAERNQDDGVLSIHYNSESELTDLVSRLNRMPTGRRAE